MSSQNNRYIPEVTDFNEVEDQKEEKTDFGRVYYFIFNNSSCIGIESEFFGTYRNGVVYAPKN